MSVVRDQRGFTLVEMLVVCVVSLVVFGATLTAFTSMYRQNRAVELQRDNVDEARLGLDRAARQLRNLANPTYTASTTISRADKYDFIFQTSDPAKTWVRYCLDTSGAGASPAAARLWMGESSNATLPNMGSTCPGTGWSRTQIVAQHVTNVANGVDRPIFTYGCLAGAAPGCPAGPDDYPKLTTVGAQLYVDARPSDNVHEMQVSTGVFLRNQNQAPTASVGNPNVLGPHRISLNGTGSSDPEGRTLDFFWFMDSAPPSSELANCTQAPPSAIWEGPLLIKDFGSGATGSHDFWLVVRDPGCLTSTYGPVRVPVPTS